MLTYLRLGLLIAFVAIVGVALWYRGEAIRAHAARDRALADLGAAVAANRAQEATIGRLRATAEINDRLLAEIAEQLASINAGVADQAEAVKELADANEDVRAYLGQPVPDALRLQLDR